MSILKGLCEQFCGYNCESCLQKCEFQVHEKIYLYYSIYSSETSGLFWQASLPQKSHVNRVVYPADMPPYNAPINVNPEGGGGGGQGVGI